MKIDLRIMRVVLLCTAGLLLFSGCAAGLKNGVKTLGRSFRSHQPARSDTNATDANATQLTPHEARLKILDENDTQDLLWTYKAGAAAMDEKLFLRSTEIFDISEQLIKKYDEQILAGKFAASVVSLLTNDNFLDYTPRIYEKIMVNTYKGIDFMLAGRFADARVEFNRAMVRQDRAKEFFAKEIEQTKKKIKKEQKEELKKKGAKGSRKQYKKTLRNKKTLGMIEKRYSNLFAFKPYRDFVNPFSTYMAGLYFYNVHDYRKAEERWKEAYGMIRKLEKGAGIVRRDLRLAVAAKRSGRKHYPRHYTWVVFLNGEGPVKKDLIFNIPLFLVSSNIAYARIALPTLKMRQRAYPDLEIRKGKRRYKTGRIASMDRIIKAEFKKRFDLVVTRALARTVTQAIIQKQLQDHFGIFGTLVGAAYQAVMNQADIRIWDSLPKDFQVARVRSGGKIAIRAGGKTLYTLKTSRRRNYVVLVRIAEKGDQPIISVAEFK